MDDGRRGIEMDRNIAGCPAGHPLHDPRFGCGPCEDDRLATPERLSQAGTLDGFDAWRLANGLRLTENIDGDEVVR